MQIKKVRGMSRRAKSLTIILAISAVILFSYIKFPIRHAWKEYHGCPSYYRIHIGYLLELSYAGSVSDRLKGEVILGQAEAAFTTTGLTEREAYRRFGPFARYTVTAEEMTNGKISADLELLSASFDHEGSGYLWVRISNKINDKLFHDQSVHRWSVGRWEVDAITQAP